MVTFHFAGASNEIDHQCTVGSLCTSATTCHNILDDDTLADGALQLEGHQLVHLGSKLHRKLLEDLHKINELVQHNTAQVLPSDSSPSVFSIMLYTLEDYQRGRGMQAGAAAHLGAEATDDHANRLLSVNTTLLEIE